MSDSKRVASACGPQAGQPRLAVDWVPTGELVPYAGNAKEHTDEQVGEISESIKEFGFSDPVGAWHDPDGRPVIVEGHGRVLAARRLGLATVPVVWLDHLDDEGRRAYGLVHNQLTMGTGWDEDALAAELASLEDIDLSNMGFDLGTSEDEYGTTFSLPVGGQPNQKVVTLLLDQDQYELFGDTMQRVGKVDGGGNDRGNRVCEVIRRWMAE